jgi:hypothetical protein
MSQTAENKPKRGRPYGTYLYDEPRVTQPVSLTSKAHQWVQDNKAWIEVQARQS